MPDASFLSSDLFLLTLTVGLYCLGGMIYRRTRPVSYTHLTLPTKA